MILAFALLSFELLILLKIFSSRPCRYRQPQCWGTWAAFSIW